MKLQTLLLLVGLFVPNYPLEAQKIGDAVRLDSKNVLGVPVHPAAGDPKFVRWANATVGKVSAVDAFTGWFQVEATGRTGWVTKSYITVVTTDPEDGPTESPEDEIPFYVIGTWNLEWFKDGKERGFPESTYGGPKYGARTEEDYQLIAGMISTQLVAKILVLNEINGRADKSSTEMNRLVGYLGTNWTYDLAGSGDAQRTALLYDTSAVRRDSLIELAVPKEKVDGKDIFDRDPLAARFTFLGKHGVPKNDLILVGIHLASIATLVANHNRAMEVLRIKLHEVIDSGAFPSTEKDVVIMGDLNASRYDTKVENFWTDYDSGGFQFRTVSPEDEQDYPGTRLAGVPLMPKSKIDYILASDEPGGLVGKLVQIAAEVHTELLPSNFNLFREHVSDHLPVTVRVSVMSDDD